MRARQSASPRAFDATSAEPYSPYASGTSTPSKASSTSARSSAHASNPAVLVAATTASAPAMTSRAS
ncbi:MAG TPA: hypothetical protein VFV35_05730, partial [Acidimicrobiales bacterium]|nr:hypothetical protein [Acidimicrobiales bacterium]